jgi:hypothetical protein
MEVVMTNNNAHREGLTNDREWKMDDNENRGGGNTQQGGDDK